MTEPPTQDQIRGVMPSWGNVGNIAKTVFSSRSNLSFGGAKVEALHSGTPMEDIGAQPAAQLAVAALLHNYTVFDRSAGGGTPKIGVSIGSHLDTSTNTTWIPTLGGTALDATPAAFTVGNSDTRVWFKLTVNELDGSGSSPAGAITAIELDSGTAVPVGDNTHVYQLCAVINVVNNAGAYTVFTLEGGVQGSQAYQVCGSNGLFGLV